MKSKMTKLAVAAVIIVAVVFSIILLDKTTTSAYAVEQTIQAMRSISSVHAYSTDWDGRKLESWLQIDPETGEAEYQYSDYGNLLIVGTPQVSYFYHRDVNRVRIQKGKVRVSKIRYSRFFEDTVRYVQEHDGKLKFHRLFDEDLRKEVIMVHVTLPVQEIEIIIRIDPQTKLPINMEAIDTGHSPRHDIKSVDLIEYNVPVPEGIFDFEIPEGAEIVETP